MVEPGNLGHELKVGKSIVALSIRAPIAAAKQITTSDFIDAIIWRIAQPYGWVVASEEAAKI